MASKRKRGISRDKAKSSCTAEQSVEVELFFFFSSGASRNGGLWGAFESVESKTLMNHLMSYCEAFLLPCQLQLWRIYHPYPCALGVMINAGEGPGLGKDSVHHSSGWVTQGVGGCGSNYTVMWVIEEWGRVRPSNLEGFGLCPQLAKLSNYHQCQHLAHQFFH